MNSVKTKHRLSQNFKECRIKPKQINEMTHSIIQHPIPTRLYSSNVLMNPPRKPAPLQLPHKISLLPLQSQHNPPALNCPLKWSIELTPEPLHWVHDIAPFPSQSAQTMLFGLVPLELLLLPSVALTSKDGNLQVWNTGFARRNFPATEFPMNAGRFRETEGQRGVEFTTVAILKRLLSRRMRWKSSCESAFQFSNIYFFSTMMNYILCKHNEWACFRWGFSKQQPTKYVN